MLLVANSAIGIVQEVRAKRTLDQLAVLNAPRRGWCATARSQEIAVEEVVLDDLFELRTGDQIPCDGVVRTAAGLEVDESLLTGESDPVDKDEGDEVLSGSFVVAGSGRFQATRVGADSYAAKLATEARQFQLTRSELMDGINTILRIITWVLIPASRAAALEPAREHELDAALRSTVAGVVGMVPEGLVLLTSVAFMLAAVTLARRKVLVQELPAVEGLARVDVVCLDKTGTLTEGDDRVRRGRAARRQRRPTCPRCAGRARRRPNRNATLVALAERVRRRRGGPAPARCRSRRRASGARATFEGHGSWVMGAPEMVLTDARDAGASPGRRARRRAGAACSCSRTPTLPLAGEIAARRTSQPVALVMFAEKVRPDAAETLAYFAAQGVDAQGHLGRQPAHGRRGRRARRARRRRAAASTRASSPRTSTSSPTCSRQHSVFGRVTPQQKRAMVGALQSKGHVVAMTGDGVNDALALKDADIGVAMGSGAAATRAVAQLVLLDGKFSTLPGVVAEGRRVIANIERSANLFVTKTVYAVLLAIVVVDHRLAVPVPAAAPHDHQHVHHRHPRASSSRSRPTRAATSPASSSGCCASASRRARRGHRRARRATASRATATTCRCARRAPRRRWCSSPSACGCSCSRPARSTGGRRCSSRRWSGAVA